jgi:hypothetical protein
MKGWQRGGMSAREFARNQDKQWADFFEKATI